MQAMSLELVDAAEGDFDILTDDALGFLAHLHRRFNATRRQLLADRATRLERLDGGEQLDFLARTAALRASDWTIAPLPADLMDRRVEITGPTDRKMIINALNSGANVFMADLEDSSTPTWSNCISGQRNLIDAVRRTITFGGGDGEKHYALNEETATLLVRPRGWHLDEKHLLIDGEVMSGSLFDFGLYFFHNAQELINRGTGPYFYLPKMESHLEARLWNDVFVAAQDYLGVPQGTIRATVLIETIMAAFEMDEILFELREHSAGLNCGRWDYIFSCIKASRGNPDLVLADRSTITMTTHFMRSYSLLAIRTCHRRKAPAIGGMAAQIPIKRDPVANAAAMSRVRDDKEREAGDGHDGTWVAHPGLVPIAKAAFDAVLTGPNQIHRLREDVNVTAKDLLAFGPNAPITEHGLRMNLNISIRYMGSWLDGVGCVPIFDLMEDAATAEISRAQLWQWVHSPKGQLEDGRQIDAELVHTLLGEELQKVRDEMGDRRYVDAAALVEQLVTSDTLAPFLTSVAYELIN